MLAHGQAGRERGGNRPPHVGGERLELRTGRRVVVQVALAVADDADLHRGVEALGHELGRAAADVDDEQPVRRARRARAGEGELGLLVAAEDRAAQPGAGLQLGREAGAVGRVAHRRGHHRERVLGALLRDRRGVALRHGEHALPRVRPQPPAGLQAVTEPGDERLADDLAEATLRVDVGDEQPRRVGPDVHGRGPHPGA